MNLEWMAWTPVTACFFLFIAILLLTMGVWQAVSPTIERRGFLPITTTRGDRLFIGLLTSAYIHIIWVGLTDWNLWIAVFLSALCIVIILRFG